MTSTAAAVPLTLSVSGSKKVPNIAIITTKSSKDAASEPPAANKKSSSAIDAVMGVKMAVSAASTSPKVVNSVCMAWVEVR